MSDNNTNYYIAKLGNDVVPTSRLDKILVHVGSTIIPSYLSFIDGTTVTADTYIKFVENVAKNITNNVYPTTDHLFCYVVVNGIKFLYVSLDNSVRANSKGFPLYKRLDAICEVVSKCLAEKTIVFFSEACRSSFDGGDLSKRINEQSWFQMRTKITAKLGLTFLGECTNNDDTNGMSFGVAAFGTNDAMEHIHSIFPRKISTKGFGSGAVGVKMLNGDVVWGIHFPLDFKGNGSENLGAEAMKGLVEIMKTYTGSVCAIGDFNTIPGKIAQCIKEEVPANLELRDGGFYTFYGAYYDTMLPKEGEDWKSI